MASLDLYKLLGITRSANKTQVHAAYRRKAKSAHPDAGGNPELFARIAQARAVLTDDTLRAQYNDTGEIGEKHADNDHAEASQQLCSLFAALVDKCAEENMDPLGVDMMGAVRDSMHNGLGLLRGNIREVEKRKRRDSRLLGRVKKKTAGFNMFERIIEQRIAVAERELVRFRHDQKIGELALVILTDYSFEGDQKAAMANHQTLAWSTNAT